MKTHLDCIPCFFRQALDAACIAGASDKTKKRIINKVAKALPKISLYSSPPEIARYIYGSVNKVTRKKDTYKNIKTKSNNLALSLYSKLKDKVRRSKNRLLTAVELAIAGNVIDYGVKNSLNVNKELKRILAAENESIKKSKKKLFNYPQFKKYLKKSKNILYIGDNAGETVFDSILIEEINDLFCDKEIIYAVRAKPVINDALKEDAIKSGIHKSAKIVSSGIALPGTVLKFCSKKFLNIYKKADMIISKGQGNFEALSDAKKPVFFLFMAKCPVVARDISSKVGDVILLYNKRGDR